MRTIPLYSKFDFDGFMAHRGWSSLISLVLWLMLVLLTVYKSFNFHAL